MGFVHRHPALLAARRAVGGGPGSLTTSVAASADDCRESTTVGSTTDLTFAGINMNTTTIAAGMIFRGATPPPGATITVAYITFVCSVAAADSTISIHGIKETNPAAFTATVDNLKGRALTTASVSWTPSFVLGTSYQTPSLASIVTELIGQAGYAAGNALGFRLIKTAGSGGQMASWDNTTYAEPQLTLEWT